MSCGSDFFTSNCVCDTLLAIVEAQDKINPITDECSFGCSRAIQELVGGTTATGNDTIPVILICKSTCAPFQATGVRRDTQSPQTPFEVVCGCVFRVIDVDPETCCATLEILGIRTGQGSNADFTLCEGPNQNNGFGCVENLNNATALVRSGVCITVDLNCFCGVSCIFPQNLL
ncbi:CotY/CotZ family spore coat protein [Neobacillus sp. YIM B06451]|uniref:CotY/CotZ family spore coat protein n=1 Tax=Neobacillus sp. YIM B06451 TaxID=3070994 RepID=UPI00292F6D39|nr:CotY/CotZ family spore coat protein [Neobacillus sp. YIM B06451]